MPNQIFKEEVPTSILYNLLEDICLKTEKYYLIDINAYRKMIFHKLNEPFCEELKEYYHLGKQTYITREMTYKSFTNIIRQICKASSIMFTSQMKYSDSKYNIVFFIYF